MILKNDYMEIIALILVNYPKILFIDLMKFLFFNYNKI